MLKTNPQANLKRIAGLFAFGADPESDPKEPERIKEPTARKVRVPERDEDDDDDDFDFSGSPDQRRIAKLSKENARRRNENKAYKEALAQKDEEIEELRAELKKGEKLQRAYDKLKVEHEGQNETVRKMAITNAILAEESQEGDAARAWYDVSMVYSLLNRDDLAVDVSDFSVGGIKEQLDRIAEEKPFLVKKAESKDETRNQNRQQPSGSAPQSSATGNSTQQKEQGQNEMISNFPALGNLV